MILERLLQSHWPPGSRLSIDGLARDLGVSPTPVREALVSLEQSGLVEYTALRGYVIAPKLTVEQIDELLDARSAIETAVLSRAFRRWESLVVRLDQAHAAHAEVVHRIEAMPEPQFGDVREHFQRDWAFHQVLFDHAGNRYLNQIVEVLRPHTHRMRQSWEGAPVSLDVGEALSEHAAILDMVQQRNHDGANRALLEHLSNVRARSVALELGLHSD